MATLVNNNPSNQTTNYPDGTSPYQLGPDAAGLLGPTLTGAADSLYASQNVSSAEAAQAVSELFAAEMSGSQDVFQAQITSAEDIAQGQAEAVTAAGDTAEANAYLQASTIADQNASMARASAGLQSAAEDRNIYKSISGQTADVAGGGFGSAGSAMYLMADSTQQGSVAKQLINVQGAINAGGYQQQSLAAQAEASAAQGAAGAATILGAQDTATAGMLTQYATQTAADLQIQALNGANQLINTAGTGADGTSGTGAGGGYVEQIQTSTGGYLPINVSVQEAAADAAMLSDNQNTVQINAAGRKAAAQYLEDVRSGKIKPVAVSGGGIRVVG